MTNRKYAWYEKTVIRKFVEIILAAVFLTIVTICIPMSTYAEGISGFVEISSAPPDGTATETLYMVDNRISSLKTGAPNVPELQNEDTSMADPEHEPADKPAGQERSETQETSDLQENEIAYRIKPLQEKLAALDDKDIENVLLSYGDMDSHWSRKEVGMLSYIDIIVGYNGMFSPDDQVQVDQFLKMTVRSMGFSPAEDTEYWAQNYIDIALQHKLITEKEFSEFKRPITREEATKIIVKAALLKEEFPYNDPYNNPDNLVRSKIRDYAEIKDGNKQYVLQSYEIGLIRGWDGMFRPAGTLTRAEAATIMVRYLDDASRVPFTPAEDEVYTCENYDGVTVTAWPPPRKEIIDAANTFRSAWPKTKGYVVVLYNDMDHRLMYTFYENEDIYKRNSILNMQMGVDIDINNDIYLSEHPYHITLYDADAVKRLHRDVIYEMFKFWFENDIDKAMSEFDRYLGYATSGDQEHRIDEITYNGRLMFFYKVGGDDGFSLTICSKE